MGARILVATCLLWAGGCASAGPGGLFGGASPYETYADQLERAGLASTALGRDWVAAGQRSLATPAVVETPFLESAYHPAEDPTATAYRLALVRGRRLVVDVQVESLEPVRVFVDLFETDGDDPPERVASLEPGTTTLSHDVRRDGTYLLRVQPELLRDVRITVSQRTESTLRFPVEGKTAGAVQSGFGAARDGGVRSHEGIDIFAPRGTAVTAVTSGVARPSTNGLGGNVVWLRGDGRTFYYAHLDRWAIDDTVQVAAGDVLGYVGNSGNARTTSPHLHFGIYDDGAIDPLPFVQPDDPAPPPPTASPERLGQRVRVARARAALRPGVSSELPVAVELPRATVATVAGIAEGAVRLRLPDGTVGFVDADATTPVDASPVRTTRLDSGTPLLSAPASSAPVRARVDTDAAATVVGHFNGYGLVRTADGREGWVADYPR